MKRREIILISICSIAIIGYLLYEFEVFQHVFSKDGRDGQFVEEHEEKLKNTEEIIEQGRKEQKNGTMTKDQLVLLIFSSTLHFDDVQGEYTLSNPLDKKKENISYALDMEQGEGMLQSQSDALNHTIFYTSEPLEKLQLDEWEKTYRRLVWTEDMNQGEEPITDTSELFSVGYGADPRIKENFVLPETINSEYVQSMKYYDEWEFEETTFLDMSCYKIYGNDSGYYEGDTFEMVVEKNTGIVLDYSLIDENNNEIISLTTNEIHIDEGIDKDIFSPDLTEYEKADTSDVPDEFKQDHIEEGS